MKICTHDYAKQAYPLVESIKGSDMEAGYRTQALNLPTMIMQSGLAQAIGFLKAKGQDRKSKPEFTQLLEHMDTLLKLESEQKSEVTLHDKILKSNMTEYQLLTRKAIDASGWLKRYTEALLGKENQAVNKTDSKPDAQDGTQEQTIEQEIAQNIEEPNT